MSRAGGARIARAGSGLREPLTGAGAIPEPRTRAANCICLNLRTQVGLRTELTGRALTRAQLTAQGGLRGGTHGTPAARSLARSRLGPLVGCLLFASLGCQGGNQDEGTAASHTAAVTVAAPATGYCAFDEVRCSGHCVHTPDDSHNCGGCDTVCPGGASCIRGRCIERAAGRRPLGSDAPLAVARPARCPAWQSWCDGACIDTADDVANCGACANVCDSGRTCIEGHCLDPATRLAAAARRPPR